MEPIGYLDEIRKFVQFRFAAYGAATDAGILETILVRDSQYCGRRFSCDGWRAVWFVEERHVKFFDAEGRFKESLDLDSLPEDATASAASPDSSADDIAA